MLSPFNNMAMVIAKKNIKLTDKFTACGLRKFLERDYHEAEINQQKKNYLNRIIFRKDIGEQTLNLCIYIYRYV